MAEKNSKFNKSKSGLILACFLVLLAVGAGLFMAYCAFSGQLFKVVEQKLEIKTHAANPDQLSFYENLYKFPEKKVKFDSAPIAGVIPHHLLAGDMIAEFFANLEKYDYDTVILLGPNHFNAGTGKIISSAEDWQTPYGILSADQDILEKLTGSGEVDIEENVFPQEHSIYSEVAFIKKTFPRAKFLPLVLRPNLSSAEAEKLARALFEISSEKKVLLISSTDFSHYKTGTEAQADDFNSLKILKNNSLDLVYSMAVDSPPATYVLMKYADLAGVDFVELNNSNSAILSGNKNASSTTSYITGYFEIPEMVGVARGNSSGFLPTASSSRLNLLFFGDIMLDRHVGEKIKASGTLDWIFSRLNDAGIFQGNDLVSANLEGAVTDNGAHYPPFMGIDFAFAPAVVGELKKFGFNFFNIANNHLSDQGKNGIIETEKNLAALGFNFSGCQDREVSDCASKIIEIKGRKIGMVGASMVYGTLDENKLLAEVKKLASSTDLVVAQMHWGTEYQHEPAKNQIALAHKLIDAGADIVIGHHPHVVGGIEIYKNKPIFYSLGNFVFDQYFSTDTQEELGVKIIPLLSKEGVGVVGLGRNMIIDLLPIKSEAAVLRLMNKTEKSDFLEKLAGWSIGGEDFKKQIRAGFIEINN
jgi:AmmeMemoRadiSam system protein B